mmetsp:Transcript_26537/g.65903  ORF Transcript_26537/g.65903 Transcript_26537/m.65903 type:complete len:241 (+) Transcript_26537:703-1425(+)
MNRVVHGNEEYACGHLVSECVPAVEEHRQVVVPMQEAQRLLAQNQKQRVHHLDVLRVDEKSGPDAGHGAAIGEPRRPAAGECEAIGRQQVQQVRHRPHCPHHGEHRQRQVPQDEQASEVPRRPLGHVPGASCDEHQVEEGRQQSQTVDLTREGAPCPAEEGALARRCEGHQGGVVVRQASHAHPLLRPQGRPVPPLPRKRVDGCCIGGGVVWRRQDHVARHCRCHSPLETKERGKRLARD